MKIGINRWTMPPDWSLAKCFSESARAGFESIEINIAEAGELTLGSTESEVLALVSSAKDAGIQLSSLSNGLGWKYPLTDNDPSTRAKGIEVVRTSLKVAHWMGVDTFLCVPGMVTPQVAYDVAYDRARDALGELSTDAAKWQVSIGVENVWNKFLLSPLEMARFVDETGSPWIGVYFDAGNILAYGYPQHWIRILGARIKKVHVKDFKPGIGNLSGFCNPLNGDVPWSEVRSSLEAVGYDSYITAEVDGYPHAPELGLKHIADALRLAFK